MLRTSMVRGSTIAQATIASATIAQAAWRVWRRRHLWCERNGGDLMNSLEKWCLTRAEGHETIAGDANLHSNTDATETRGQFRTRDLVAFVAMETRMNTPIKFRENAQTAVVRDAHGIQIWVRGIDKPAVNLKWSQLSQAVREEGMGYGMEVRLTRATAIEHSKSGRPATAQERFDALKRLGDHYASGTDKWTMESAGISLSADTRVLIEALVRALGLSPEVAEEQCRAMSIAERDALRVDDDIKPYVDEILLERAKAGGAGGMLAQNLKDKLLALGPKKE